VKGGEGEKEEDIDVAAALPHAVAPAGEPSAYCCGGERSLYSYGGTEELKGANKDEEKGGDAAAALPHAVAPMGAPTVYSCGGAEETKGCDGDAAANFANAVAPVCDTVRAPSAAAAGLYGEWRGYRKTCCFAEQHRLRINQVTRCG
jgi:hypothetical protein